MLVYASSLMNKPRAANSRRPKRALKVKGGKGKTQGSCSPRIELIWRSPKRSLVNKKKVKHWVQQKTQYNLNIIEFEEEKHEALDKQVLKKCALQAPQKSACQ